MVARRSVGTRYTEPLLVLLAIAAGAAAGFVLHAASQGPVDPVLGAVAGAVIGLFLARLGLVALGRRWISGTEKGFILENRHGTFAFTYDDIADLATKSTIRFSGGVPHGTIRSGTIVLRDGRAFRRVRFRYEFAVDRTDPLGFFFESLLTCLTDRAKAAVASGNGLRGAGWELTVEGLWVRAGLVDRLTSINDVAAVDLVEGNVCVWTTGERHPSVRIPVGTANALVLLNVLGEQVQARGIDPDETVGGLGRVMFEREPNNLVTLFVITLVFVAMMAAMGAVGGGADAAGFVGAGASVIGGAVFLIALLTTCTFRCHARGVFRRNGLRTRELRFEDVGRFAYEAVRHYRDGFYVSTSVRMSFVPKPDVGGRAITYSASLTNCDLELEALREHVSRVVGANMLRRLERDRSVQWTEGLRLYSDGIEITTRGGWFKRSASYHIPYYKIGNTEIHEGYFYLYLPGVRKAVYTTPVSADNFFPGHVLFEAIRFGPHGQPVNLYAPQVRERDYDQARR